jgi:hypothetical protein
MSRTNFEKLRVYKLSETLAELKDLLDSLAPQLNAYLKSIGRDAIATDN